MDERTLTRIYDLTEDDDKNLTQRALKLAEEAGEVAAAVLSATDAPGCEYKTLDHEDVLEELADTIIVALSLVADVGSSPAELNEIINTKLDKWERVVATNQGTLF